MFLWPYRWKRRNINNKQEKDGEREREWRQSKKGSSMQRLCVNLLPMHDKEDEKSQFRVNFFPLYIASRECLRVSHKNSATEEMENWIRSWKMSIYKIEVNTFAYKISVKSELSVPRIECIREFGSVSLFRHSAYMYEWLSVVYLFHTKGFSWFTAMHAHDEALLYTSISILCAFVHSFQSDKIEIKAIAFCEFFPFSCLFALSCCSFFLLHSQLRLLCCAVHVQNFFFTSILLHWFTERIFR